MESRAARSCNWRAGKGKVKLQLRYRILVLRLALGHSQRCSLELEPATSEPNLDHPLDDPQQLVVALPHALELLLGLPELLDGLAQRGDCGSELVQPVVDVVASLGLRAGSAVRFPEDETCCDGEEEAFCECVCTVFDRAA